MNDVHAFEIESANIVPGAKISEEQVFNGFGCTGKNISPQLSWKNAPKDTKSFAVTIFDPDAPTGSGWWHWLVLNIPTDYKKLPLDFGRENKFALKDGVVQIRNDFGDFKFGGPCPPKGDKPHHYIITLYALKTEKLDVSEKMTAANAAFMINHNVIAKTQLTGLYGRQ